MNEASSVRGFTPNWLSICNAWLKYKNNASASAVEEEEDSSSNLALNEEAEGHKLPITLSTGI